MQKLYLDCDGVILDTINKSYQMIKDKGITSEEEAEKFYKEIDWKMLIEVSGEIDDSIQKIKRLYSTGVYDISILTHVISKGEADAKIEYFSRVLPEVEVIIVPKNIHKADMICARDAILVDDYLPNLDYWKEMGGIPVKFSSSGKECKYETITSLSDLLSNTKIKKIEVM